MYYRVDMLSNYRRRHYCWGASCDTVGVSKKVLEGDTCVGISNVRRESLGGRWPNLLDVADDE